MSFQTDAELESVRMVAKEAAAEAVALMSLKLEERDEKLHDKITESVEGMLKTYFGDQTPSQHTIQHARMDSLLKRLDGISDNFWGGIVTGIAKWVIVGVLGALAYSKIKG
jgi:hypothetical protein